MSCDFERLPHTGIQTLAPYIPGKSIEELAKEQGLTDIIKLASNENPRGCSPKVHDALKRLPESKIASYPIPHAHPLPRALATQLNIDVDMLCLSNGSDALFQLLMTGFALHLDKHIITHEYAFQTYSILANVLGIPLVKTPLRNDWQVDINAIINACNEKTALIFIANPNNPTGTLIDRSDIVYLLENIPSNTILVLDEAYHEFLDKKHPFDTISLLSTFPNLFITRTFSKAYGLAGLRLGYGISDPSICALLQKIVLPFTINQAALAAGLVALLDQAFMLQSVELNRIELKRVREQFTQLGYECLPSFGNFITFDCQIDGAIIYNALLKHGIIVRPLHPYGLNNYLRVTIGTAEQNTRFLDTIMQIQRGIDK